MFRSARTVPIVAIANYGPHPSLEETIEGIKESLAQSGFVDGKEIVYKITSMNFDQSVIPQTVNYLLL